MGLSERFSARLRGRLDPERDIGEETDTEGRRTLAAVDVPEAPAPVRAFGERLRSALGTAAQKVAAVDDRIEDNAGYAAAKGAAASGFGAIVDVLSRGQYFAAGAVDASIEQQERREREGSVGNPFILFKDALSALASGAAEALSPEKRLSFLDVLRRHAPEFVEKNPKTAWTMSLAGDILVDPLNLIGLGEAKSAIRVTSLSGKALAVDRAAYRKTFRELLEQTGEGVAPTLRDRLARAVRKMEPGEEATVKKLDEMLAAREASIRQTYEPQLASLEAEFGEHLKPVDAVPGLSDFAPHRKPASDQLALFDDPGKAPTKAEIDTEVVRRRDDVLKRREMVRAQFDQEMRDHLALRQRVENAVGTGNKQRMQVLHDFLNNRPTSDAIHDLTKDTAEARMRALLDDPKFVSRIADEGGFKIAGKSLVPKDVLEKTGKLLGVDKLKKRLRELDEYDHDVKVLTDDKRLAVERGAGWQLATDVVRGVTSVARTFNRNFGLPEEYLVARRQYESSLLAAHKTAVREAQVIFGRLPIKSRERVNALARQIDDMRGQLKRAGVDDVHLQDEIAKAVNNAKLTPEEMGAYVRMRQQFTHFRSLEQELGLLEKVHADYHPVAYRLVRNAKTWFGAKRMFNGGLSSFFGPGEARVFLDEAAARAAGLDPVTDAMALYVLRATQHQRGVATELFRQRVEDMFDGLKVERNGLLVVDIPHAKVPVRDASGAVVRQMEEAPKSATMTRVADDLTYIGEGAYSPQAGPFLKFFLPKYDALLGFVRKASTVVRPAFSVKQGVSNAMQSYLGAGWEALRPGSAALAHSAIKAMGAFDPRSTLDAGLLLAGEAGSFSIVNTLGQKLSGVQIAKEALDNGVVRGITLDGVGMREVGGSRWVQAIERELGREEMFARWRSAGEKVGGKVGAAASEGFRRFVSGLARYTDFPAKVEDFSRMTLFVNARRMGYSAPEAARLVNQQLFDYMHGLSKDESRFMRRMVPFWSYRRFAIPMIGKVLAKTPGRVANLAKATDRFFEAYGKIARGESLTEEERFNTLPGWVLEQPHAIAEHNGILRSVVHTFNGFSPTDVLAEFMPGADDHGSAGTRRWIEQAFLSQITPFVKVPFEYIAKKEFFSGRNLEGPYKRNLKNVDPDVLLSTLAAEIAMTTSGNTMLAQLMGQGGVATMAGAGTMGAAKLSPKAVERTLQVLLGWEKATDPRTGKEAVYVNPYRWNLAAGLFPPLNDAVKFSNKDRTPLARARHFLFGVNETEVNSQQAAQQKLSRMRREIEDKKREVRQRSLERALVGREEALKDLQELYSTYQEEAERLRPVLTARE